MKLFRTTRGTVVEKDNRLYLMAEVSWDSLVTRDDLEAHLSQLLPALTPMDGNVLNDVLAPIGKQEVWAAGVTYYRSRTARMEESKTAAGGDFYDRVYSADRPELFFKATPHRVVGHNGKVAVRGDSRWSVPEPELALLVTPKGKIVGYTVANDMSARDIEGENPLYLPQAKIYNRSCSLGPGILVTSQPLPDTTEIRLEILRAGKTEVAGSTTLQSMKRKPTALVECLFDNNSFPDGCFLSTGTGIVPPDEFSLVQGDEIRIAIDGIGTLVNYVG